MTSKLYFSLACILMLSVLVLTDYARPNGEEITLPVKDPSISKKKVTVGVDHNYPPFEFVDEKGNVRGFNIDIITALAEVMGLELEFIAGPWNVIRQRLESGSLDMVSGMYYSDERDVRVDFSVPFIVIHESMFVRIESPLDSLSHLENKEIIVQKGDIMHDYVVDHQITDNIIEVKNTLDAIRLIASGSHDAALLPKIQGQYFLTKYKITNVEAAGSAILAQQYCFAVKNGDVELTAILDQGLSIINNSGKYKEIREKWFGFGDRKNYEFLLSIVLIIVSALFFLLSASWFWGRSLRRHVDYKTKQLEEELSAHQTTLRLLKDKEAHLNALVQSSPDAILVFDKQLLMTNSNPTFTRHLGYRIHEINGKPLSFILPNNDLATDTKEAVLIEIETNGVLHDERYYKKKSGELIPMETTLSAILLPNGRREGYVAIMRDISKRKQAEIEKDQLEDQLRQVHKMEAIGTLAAGISHDFNNILASIIGYGELAKRSLNKEIQAKQDLEEVLESANQAKKLVRQILTYSRRTEQERSAGYLTTFLNDSLRLLRASLPAHIEIRKDLNLEDDLVLADPTQISQVIINIVTNAAHAIGDDQGIIDIKLRKVLLNEEFTFLYPNVSSGFYMELTISDNGHGIEKHVQERIFDPFFTTKRRGEGTGMGLSVAQGIIKDHGGLIKVESELGTGTSFKVYLPYYDGSIEEFTAIGPIIGGNERILLIDDEVKVVNAWERILASLGYNVVSFTSPVQGFNEFRTASSKFDVVITDVDMPEMNGLKLIENLKSVSPRTKVIVHTGYTTTPTEDTAKDLDVEVVLYKPVSTYQMAEALRGILDKADTQQISPIN